MSPTPRIRRRAVVRLAAGALAASALAVTAAAPARAADPSDLQRYYRYFDRGPALIPGDDTPWVPQGLAYWPERDALVISYYDGEKKQNSRIAVVDRTTGKREKLLSLPTKGHVGGLAMSQGFLWTADGGRVTRYAKKVLNAASGTATPVKAGKSWPVKASSYLTIAGSSLWVGAFTEAATGTSVAYRYDLSGKQVPGAAPAATISTPTRVQGMAVVGGKIVWSRSWGRNNRSRIDVAPAGAPTQPSRIFTAPNMSEGIVAAQGELHVLYESGSSTYADASYRVKTIHHGAVGPILGP